MWWQVSGSWELAGGSAREYGPWRIAGLVCVGLLIPVIVLGASAPDLEERVREIAAGLRCVVCQNLSVADSPSELAKEMRNLVRELVQQGKSRDEILAYFVSRYGEFVLLSPPKRGFNLLVWALPFVALVAGGYGVYLVTRRWTAQSVRIEPPVDPAYAERVRRDLQDRAGPAGS